MDNRDIHLYGRVILRGDVHALSGLHIGASKDALGIGDIDLPVIRDAHRRPYIPGSSLKGKMRSQWEKLKGAKQEHQIGRIAGKEVFIHACGDAACPVCAIYGTLGDKDKDAPTRLTVRDISLRPESLEGTTAAILYSEVKWEAAIDRVTSAASPRQIERVPAGAVFGPMELVFSIYGPNDRARVSDLLTGLQLVEDDYLGGQGSRGSGKVAFRGLAVVLKVGDEYREITDPRFEAKTLGELIALRADLLTWIEERIPVRGGG
jgi:CRISPR-associated protein Csm3